LAVNEAIYEADIDLSLFSLSENCFKHSNSTASSLFLLDSLFIFLISSGLIVERSIGLANRYNPSIIILTGFDSK
jgi:hypothetical protein